MSVPLDGASYRRAFSLLELVVAMAVITLLLALLLPAVASTREQSRRVHCTANLRQLGIATEAFYAAIGEYPTPRPPPGQSIANLRSFQSQLLPYLDQQVLYHQLVPEVLLAVGEPPFGPKNRRQMETNVFVFMCPSDDVPAGGINYRANYGTTPGVHATWSRQSGKPRPDPIEEESLWGGFMGVNHPTDVTDGLSHTAFFSERLVGDGDPKTYTPSRDVISADGVNVRPPDAVANCTLASPTDSHVSFLGWSWLPWDYSQTGYNHVLTPNSRIPDCFDHWNEYTMAQGAMTARSVHPGGVNVLFGDGSTRFVSEAIDLWVWRRLGTNHGGEVVSDF